MKQPITRMTGLSRKPGYQHFMYFDLLTSSAFTGMIVVCFDRF
jgi:hypothetical protein